MMNHTSCAKNSKIEREKCTYPSGYEFESNTVVLGFRLNQSRCELVLALPSNSGFVWIRIIVAKTANTLSVMAQKHSKGYLK